MELVAVCHKLLPGEKIKGQTRVRQGIGQRYSSCVTKKCQTFSVVIAGKNQEGTRCRKVGNLAVLQRCVGISQAAKQPVMR